MAKRRSIGAENLPEDVAASAFRFGRAVFRCSIKNTSHRTPTESEVENKFQAFLNDGRFIDDVRRHVAKCEGLVKAAGIKLDNTGRAIARQLVIDRLDTYTRLTDRPKGRPKKPRISLINGLYYKSVVNPDTTHEKARIAALTHRLAAHTAGTKLRMFMRSQKKDDLDLQQALQYICDNNLGWAVFEMRGHSKALKNFLAVNRLDQDLSPRLEKWLSRNRKAVDDFLEKKLQKERVR